MAYKNTTYKWPIINKDEIDSQHLQDMADALPDDPNKETKPFKTFKNAYTMFGLVSCKECNTTNPADKEICSGCGLELKFIIQG